MKIEIGYSSTKYYHWTKLWLWAFNLNIFGSKEGFCIRIFGLYLTVRTKKNLERNRKFRENLNKV